MCNANIICSFCWYLGGYSIPTIASYDEKYTQRGHGFSPCPLIFLLGWCTLGGAVVPARLCRLPEQELHQQNYWDYCLVGALETSAPPERLLHEYLLNLAVSRANDVQTLLELRKLNAVNCEECCCALSYGCSVDAGLWL